MKAEALIERFKDNGYPTSDGKPVAETDLHRFLMFLAIHMLDTFFKDDPQVYVSGNLLLFYEEGNRRRHVSPDVFVVRGVQKAIRPNYLVWEEKKAPEFVLELTSSSTRREDQDRKYRLYQDVLRVKEYFLFDPTGDWLSPRLQGHRLHRGQYRRIREREGRLSSRVLGLHLETAGDRLRFFNPATVVYLPTIQESLDLAERALQEKDAALEQMRREMDEMRRRLQQPRRNGG